MLDLDGGHPRWTDGNDIDLVGAPARVLGVAQVGEQHPMGAHGLELGLQTLDGLALALVDEDSAGDVTNHDDRVLDGDRSIKSDRNRLKLSMDDVSYRIDLVLCYRLNCAKSPWTQKFPRLLLSSGFYF